MTHRDDIVDLCGDQRSVAGQVDRYFEQGKAFAVVGHGVPTDLTAAVRAEARRIFALPAEVKRQMPYTSAWTGGERGWIPLGGEALGVVDDDSAVPDLKECLAFGNEEGAGDPESDAIWFGENVWPEGFPEFKARVVTYEGYLRSLADRLLAIFALALGVNDDFFASRHVRPPYSLLFVWYPALSRTGAPVENQFRAGAHTDNNTFAILERQTGTGGLQIRDAQGEWHNAPYAPNSFTVMAGDLLTRWSGDRWPATVHRVAMPSADQPEEELLSIVYGYQPDPNALIEPLAPPTGRVAFDPVRASDFILRKETTKVAEA